jgi:hypothetical protein
MRSITEASAVTEGLIGCDAVAAVASNPSVTGCPMVHGRGFGPGTGGGATTFRATSSRVAMRRLIWESKVDLSGA